MRTGGVDGGVLNASLAQSRAVTAATAPASASASGATGKDHAKLVDAAQQFEAMLLQQMLKPFEKADSGFGEQSEDGGGDSSSTLGSFGTEAVAKAISKGGGLGIARQIISKVSEEKQESLEKVNNSKDSVPSADKLR